MLVNITVPDIGPARVSVWFADEGEQVYEGDRIVEVLIEGATIDVSAPATGVLVEKLAFMDDAVVPGQVLGVVRSAD